MKKGRLHRVFTEHGIRGGFVHIGRRLCPVYRSIVFEMDAPAEAATLVPSLSISRYTSLAEIDDASLRIFRETYGMRLVHECERLFLMGAHLWLGFWDGQVAGICWSRSGLTRSDYFVPLQESDATILSCFTFPPFRGRGIYPAMLRYIASTLKDDRGIRRIFIDCRSYNRPSLRGIEKAGFRRIGTAVRLDLFGRIVFRFPRYLPSSQAR